MKEIIKSIRNYLNLTQEDLAKDLSLTFATVNRWENGISLPNKLAQTKLYDYCIEKKVPVYQMVMDKIKNYTQEIKLSKNQKILYHGSKSGISGKIAPISRDKCDFGKGFYMGTTVEQPATLICDFEYSKIYIISVMLTDLKVLNLKEDIEWAMFIAYNRGRMDDIKNSKFYLNYKNITEKYDVIVGSIADDRIFYVLDNFFEGNITDLALTKSLSVLKLGKQYAALTQKACKNIKIEKEINLSFFEKKFIQQISKQNRDTGISLAKDIQKKYRREGNFFDEIMERKK